MTKTNEKTIKFLVDCDKHDGTGKQFKAGEVVTMNPASAGHWTIRNLAVDLVDEVKAESKPAPKKKAKKSSDA